MTTLAQQTAQMVRDITEFHRNPPPGHACALCEEKESERYADQRAHDVAWMTAAERQQMDREGAR